MLRSGTKLIGKRDVNFMPKEAGLTNIGFKNVFYRRKNQEFSGLNIELTRWV